VNAAASRDDGGRSAGPGQSRLRAWLAARAKELKELEVLLETRPNTGCLEPDVLFPGGVFISYRRCDTGPYARLLKEHLSERFPGTPVFMDLDSIEAGLDFAEVIRDAVNSCLVLVALIGSRWVTVADEQGRRRIEDPGDYVRFEIRTALERGVRVIPVLADGAKPLKQPQLPPDLGKLARLSALELSYDRLDYDETRLAAVIDKILAASRV
jgi:TIR domain